MRGLRTGGLCAALAIASSTACGNDASGESDDVSSTLNPSAVRIIVENGGPNCSFLTDRQAERLAEVTGETLDRARESVNPASNPGLALACDLTFENGRAEAGVAIDEGPFPFVEDMTHEDFDRGGEFAYLDDDDSDLDWNTFYRENDVMVSMKTGPTDTFDLDETVAMLDELITILEEESVSD